MKDKRCGADEEYREYLRKTYGLTREEVKGLHYLEFHGIYLKKFNQGK